MYTLDAWEHTLGITEALSLQLAALSATVALARPLLCGVCLPADAVQSSPNRYNSPRTW